MIDWWIILNSPRFIGAALHLAKVTVSFKRLFLKHVKDGRNQERFYLQEK